jgi:hypothetical protein
MLRMQKKYITYSWKNICSWHMIHNNHNIINKKGLKNEAEEQKSFSICTYGF